MLILRRRLGESILIGENIKISVLDVYEGGVRLAIDAPREVPVVRTELLKAVDANRDAANEQSAPQELMKLLGDMGDSGKNGGEKEGVEGK